MKISVGLAHTERIATPMTDLKELTPIDEAMEMIDAGLGDMSDRQMVSTSEVTNLLLDVRMLLSGLETMEAEPQAD